MVPAHGAGPTCGAGKDANDLVLLTLGTGIGGGVISGGRVLHGHVGMAGEIGHMTVEPTNTGPAWPSGALHHPTAANL
jgi:predicted NBD/HSP70 family sugar kinase